MVHFRGKLALRRDLRPPHSESNVLGSNRTPGYLGQVPYIDTWLQTTTIVLPWAQFSTNRQGQNQALAACLARRKDKEAPTKLIHPRALRKILSNDCCTSQ